MKNLFLTIFLSFISFYATAAEIPAERIDSAEKQSIVVDCEQTHEKVTNTKNEPEPQQVKESLDGVEEATEPLDWRTFPVKLNNGMAIVAILIL